jgi:hypothetical protein
LVSIENLQNFKAPNPTVIINDNGLVIGGAIDVFLSFPIYNTNDEVWFYFMGLKAGPKPEINSLIL